MAVGTDRVRNYSIRILIYDFGRYLSWSVILNFLRLFLGQSIPAPNGNQKIKIKPKSKIKKNYASADCGAKILATNAEAHHSSHILNAFHDEYMLNPCNARIWFVVELCESIQPHTVSMLFSALPPSLPHHLSTCYVLELCICFTFLSSN